MTPRKRKAADPAEQVPTPVAEPVPAAPTDGAPTPAAPLSPSDEVRRILARLAEADGEQRARAAAVAEAEPELEIPHRGPVIVEEVLPMVTLEELRDAARARHGRIEVLLFRAGRELFAVPLATIEEAIEAPDIKPLPEMPASMLGVFRLRERLVPAYTPADALGVGPEEAAAALLVRVGDRRIALAIDDVEDVMQLDLSTLRDPPVLGDADALLIGVARHGRELVGVLDADALIAACLGSRTPETP